MEIKHIVETNKKKDIAIQLYSVRDKINDGGDLDVILKELSQMGYTSIEAANYNNGLFYGRTPQEFKQAVELAGMKVLSSHCSKGLSENELESGDFSETMKWWDECIAAHKVAGMKYIVTPWLDVPKTVKDLKTYCDFYNEIGKRCKQNGMMYGYHNHTQEFEKVEGKVVMLDYMIENTKPEYVFFQMDVYWVVRGQCSPVEYLNKYPSRFTMLHLKDHKEIGQSGMVGFDAIFKHAKTGGVKHVVAEIEKYSTSVEKSIKSSLDYLLNAPFVPASYEK